MCVPLDMRLVPSVYYSICKELPIRFSFSFFFNLNPFVYVLLIVFSLIKSTERATMAPEEVTKCEKQMAPINALL